MPTRRWIVLLGYGLLLIGLLVGCNTEDAQPVQTIHTRLLVRAPDGPLPISTPLTVKSRTEDTENSVSHVELYIVEFTPPNEPSSPEKETNLLVRSDAAPFDQTAFTADQTFIPTRPGDYIIKVVGYNKLGEKAESEYISFRAE